MTENEGPPAAAGIVEAAAPPVIEEDFLTAFNADVPVVEAEPEKTKAVEAEAEVVPDAEKEPELPANSSQATKDHWAKLKEEKRSYKDKSIAAEKVIEVERAEKAALAEKIAAYETQVADLAETKENAAKWADAEKELAIARVEGSEQFKKAVTEPLKAIFTKAEAMAEANEIAKEDLFNAIREGNEAKQRAMLKEILPTLDEVDRLKFARMVEDAADCYNREDEIRANALTAKKELEERQAAEGTKAQQAAKKEFSDAVSHSAEELRKRLPFVELEEGETADAVYAAMVEKAKAVDFDGATAATKAFSALSGIALVRAGKQLQAQDAKIKLLQARIADGAAAEPNIGKDKETVQAQEGDFLEDMGSFLGVSKSTSRFVGAP